MGGVGLTLKNLNLTHVSGILENNHLVTVQTHGPVLFTRKKCVWGDDTRISMVRSFDEQTLDKRGVLRFE